MLNTIRQWLKALLDAAILTTPDTLGEEIMEEEAMREAERAEREKKKEA